MKTKQIGLFVHLNLNQRRVYPLWAVFPAIFSNELNHDEWSHQYSIQTKYMNRGNLVSFTFEW